MFVSRILGISLFAVVVSVGCLFVDSYMSFVPIGFKQGVGLCNAYRWHPSHSSFCRFYLNSWILVFFEFFLKKNVINANQEGSLLLIRIELVQELLESLNIGRLVANREQV